MRKFLAIVVTLSLWQSSHAQTLFTFGNKAVDKDEFLRAYNKNKTAVADKEKALREYLDLFIKFKLKVEAALEMKLDTLPQLQYDMQSFRTQIEDSYLNNEKAVDDLLAEAFARSQKDLHITHYFVPVTPGADAPDTMMAFKAIDAMYKKLSAGKADKNSDSLLTKVKESDLGYITAFSVPYEYENLIYGLKTGQVNKPYRTRNGWHIFKNTEERNAIGRWKVAQILIALPPGDEADMPTLSRKADSVYALLKAGADFTKLAREVSDDKLTYTSGGEMPEFGAGKYELVFENEVIKLNRDGEISKPFLTPYGFHIVKRLSHSPVPADKNENTFQFDLKQKLQQDSRINIAKDLFTKEIIKQADFKKNNSTSAAELYRFADSALANPNADNGRYAVSKKVIGSFGKAPVTGKDWLDFIVNYKGNVELYQNESYPLLMDKFIAGTTQDYYKKHLEDFNADFKYQMDEFKQGNVLFEIMEKKVWGAASADTAALKTYYQAHKSNYTWAPSADILLVSCNSKATAEEAKITLQKGKNWRLLSEDYKATLQADSGRFELTQVPVELKADMPAGSFSATTINPIDETAIFAKVIKNYPGNLQRSFDEARGLVINDYQSVLEEKWIEDLKKKYPVKVNEPVFQSLLK